jgi:RluA family pseudouridine synthase
MNLIPRILFQDQLIIVLDKPPGIPVHGGPRKGESLEDYFVHLRFGYKEMPRLAHRLDRDTSGCLVLGRNDRALRKLGRLFEGGNVRKTYWAIATGKWTHGDEGTIDRPLAKVKLGKGWAMQPAGKNDPTAQSAVTDFKVLKHIDDHLTLIELYPKTGRTHQIRVHLQFLGNPILGDWLYGPEKDRPPENEFPVLHLHARSIEIPLYADNPAITVTAEPPEHIAVLIR